MVHINHKFSDIYQETLSKEQDLIDKMFIITQIMKFAVYVVGFVMSGIRC